MNNNNKKNLNKIAKKTLYGAGVNSNMVQYSFEVFKRHIVGKEILELGPAEGIMTDLLVSLDINLTVVEGAKVFCDSLVKRYPNVNVINSLFEEVNFNKKFDHIILGHVLEHVDEPVKVLKHISKFLHYNGSIICAVPNSNSIHRQAAVLMGLLKSKDAPSEADIYHGHQRCYNLTKLKRDFELSKLKIKNTGGYWLKPLSNRQIEESWTNEMIDSFMLLGEKYPEIAAEIFVVASR